MDKYTEIKNKIISSQLFSGLKDKPPNSSKVQRRKQKHVIRRRVTNINSQIDSFYGPYFQAYLISSSTLLLCCRSFPLKSVSL